MLSIEEKVRCIEKFKPEGYSIAYQEKWKSHTINTPLTTGITFLDNWNREITFRGDYPLFIQRVIEGINKNDEYIIESNSQLINIYNIHLDYDLVYQVDFDDYANIDQAKEQAIKYILGQI